MDQRRMCPHCRAFITTRDRVCPYCNETVGPRAVERRNPADLLGGLIPHARFTTVMILLINFGMFLATVIFSMQAGHSNALMGIDGRTLFDFGAKYSQAIFLGQWWRLVTAGFLHGGLLHLLMNSWVLFDLGTQVEEVYGTSRLIVFYVVSTVFGFLASAYWSPVLSVGASAGLFGLIGSMIALGMRYKTPVSSAIRGMYVRWAVYGLLFGLLPMFRVDNAAHVGGLASGFAVAYLAGIPGARRGREKMWQAAAVLSMLITVFAFLQMYVWFRSSTREQASVEHQPRVYCRSDGLTSDFSPDAVQRI
jgi:rhomboid protease GluP